MAELGPHGDRYHREVRELIATLGIEAVVAVGEPARAYLGASVEERWIPDAAAFGEVADLVRPGDAVLVKASRAVGLEGIAAEIEKIATAW
jgi:UDP-N-acetylmuramoyl-tripeptide--D-alanyl-D-alanine ligase